MRLEDLGIEPKTGRHDKRLTRMEMAFLSVLWTDHVGQQNRISARDFAHQFAVTMGYPPPSEADLDDRVDGWKRDVRTMQNHLLCAHDNIPVLSAAGNFGGYWIAESGKEVSEFYDTFRKRALTGLKKAARGKQAMMVDVVRQLAFEFEDLEDRTGAPLPDRPRGSAPAEVVDKFLEKMLHDPGRYADDLVRIGRKYGGVLLPKSHVQQIDATARRLLELVSGLV
jgi:hypothetical protein